MVSSLVMAVFVLGFGGLPDRAASQREPESFGLAGTDGSEGDPAFSVQPFQIHVIDCVPVISRR